MLMFVESCWFHVKGSCRLKVNLDGGVPGAPGGSANMRGDSRPLKLWVISALPITASHWIIIEKKVWTLQKIHTLGLPEEQSDLPASKNNLPSPHPSSTPCKTQDAQSSKSQEGGPPAGRGGGPRHGRNPDLSPAGGRGG